MDHGAVVQHLRLVQPVAAAAQDRQGPPVQLQRLLQPSLHLHDHGALRVQPAEVAAAQDGLGPLGLAHRAGQVAVLPQRAAQRQPRFGGRHGQALPLRDLQRPPQVAQGGGQVVQLPGGAADGQLGG
jgi:hypothetical protein